VALARRDLLLRVHSRRLGREDLEDCLSQATLELVARARGGATFAGTAHIANALEQKLVSRIHDRRRALAGRSPIEAAMSRAASLDEPAGAADRLADHLADVEERVAGRLELRRLREVADELTDDQRLVLACQLALNMECDEFCRRHGWSKEKFRKVAQRARARLASLVAEYGSGERCRRLEADLVAVVSRVADPRQRRRIATHLANCPGCRARMRGLRATERHVLGLLPGTALTGKGLLGGNAVLGGATAAAGSCASTSAAAGTATSASAAGVTGWVTGVAGASGAGAVGGAPLIFGGMLGSAKLGLCSLCATGLAGGVLLLVHPARPMARRTASVGTVTSGRSAHRAPGAAIRSTPPPGARAPAAGLQGGSAQIHQDGHVVPTGGGATAWWVRTARHLPTREFGRPGPGFSVGAGAPRSGRPGSNDRASAASFERSGRSGSAAGAPLGATTRRPSVRAEFRRAG